MVDEPDNSRRNRETARSATLGPLSRRQWLNTAGTGVIGLLAGCNSNSDDPTDTPAGTPSDGDGGDGGNGGSTETPTAVPTDLAHVSDQTLELSIGVAPNTLTFLATGGYDWPNQWGTPFAYQVWPLVHDAGAYGAWANGAINTGEGVLTAYEDISISEDEVTATIRDDAKWSNGDDIIGRDAAPMLLAWKASSGGRSFESIANASEDQTFTFDAVTDAEWDGKTITFYSDGGRFPADDPNSIYLELFAGYRTWSGFWNNTRIEPYKTWADTIFEHWEATKNGEADPWNNPSEEGAVTKITAALEEASPSGEIDHWIEHQQNPDNIVTSGAFQVEEINGEKNIILTKNSEFHSADRVNFDRVKVTTYREDRANWAALKSEELDLYDQGTIPQHTAESFPDLYERRYQRANGGLSLALDHAIDEDGIFTDTKVRQAVMYALNTERIAESVHPNVHTPVKVPGAHAWGTEEYVSEDWVNENLRDYSYDTDKAAELLRDAGWERSGGTWRMPDGSEATLTIPTPNETPKMEPKVASQLSNFGISTSLQTYEGSIYMEKLNNGEFEIFPEPRGTGWVGHAIIRFWWFLLANQSWTTRWNIFSNEEIRSIDYSAEEEGAFPSAIIQPATTENFSKATIQAPEIGDWGGDLKTWSPAGIAWDPVMDTEEKVRQLAWLWNYYMPFLPLSQQRQQQFLNNENWIWPSTDSWETHAVGAGTFQPEHLVGKGLVQANPDNPKDGASVEE